VYTASPNATVNHVSLQATGSTTNVSVSVVPKGTGSFSLAVPDGTTTGGNVRGANAIDLQTSRTNANQVASGANSVAIGINNRASADGSVTIGSGSTVTAIVNSVAIGASSATGGGGGRCVAIGNATASAEYSIAIGNCTASGAGAIAIAHESGAASAGGSIAIGPGGPSASGICSMAIGGNGTTSRANEIAFGFRHNAFDVRPGGFFLSATTTNATATALQARNIFGSSNFTTRANTVLHGTLHVTGIKSDGSAVAVYTRRIILKNVGGTITLVENQTIGTDYEDNASTNLTISNASPFFEVTGILNETWRWSGWFTPTCEMAYGT
jgi:Head domain of trimeric autotransporter adhesin